MPGSGSEMWEMASNTKRKAERSSHAPTLDSHHVVEEELEGAMKGL
jgi:hypothetical protein